MANKLTDLNKAIWKELEAHNNRKLTVRPQSRLEMFNEIERDKLSPLPVDHYEIKQIAFATVMQNGHVLLNKDKHYYSVPFQHIRKKVKIMYTSEKVDIYHKYIRIAIHKRNMQPFSSPLRGIWFHVSCFGRVAPAGFLYITITLVSNTCY